jgi:hypothetical protein
MTLRPCPHEPELKALLDAGQWPQAAPAELRSHAASCSACSNLALLTTAFRAERAAASAAAQLPPPGLLWWRAQLRRRNQAIERISRPILGAQLFALVTACLATLGFLFFVRHSLSQWLTDLTDPNASHSSPLSDLFSSSLLHAAASDGLTLLWNPAYLLPVLALLLLAGGVTAWLASERN